MKQDKQHFLISGAGSGIGRAIACRLSAQGAQLTLIGRRVDALKDTQKLCAHSGGAESSDAEARVIIEGVDIRDAEALKNVCMRGVQQFGAYRGVIANAGMGGPNFPGSGDRFSALVETNLIGTYQTLRAVQPHLTDQGTAHMVVISSCLARFGVAGYSGYCASKAGLLGMVRALAHELAPKVQVNAICPGWVDTDMAREGLEGMAQALNISYEQAHKQAMSLVPLGRMSKPSEIAGTVAWLVGRDALGMTGQGIDINAGSWMG